MRRPRLLGSLLTVLLAVALAVPLAALSGPATAAEVTLPPAGAAWDYQIGGARPVPEGAEVVVRDRTHDPAGVYDVCYVNAFQTQPHRAAFWQHPRRRGLVLRHHGRPVADSAWGEWLLDLRTGRERRRLARIVGRWMSRCARDGYEAVELDNLDSWTRSHRLLRRRHTLAYARLLTRAAHDEGLAVAQKNTVEVARRGPALGFDFAIVEDCARWGECGRYAEAYDDRAFLVEYDARDFQQACLLVGDRVSVIHRDRMVTPDGPYAVC